MNKIVSALHEQLDIVGRSDAIRDAQTWWSIFSFDEKTGEIKQMISQKNIIPYEGADVLARLFAGDIAYKPAAMLFEFENTAGTPTPPTPTRDEGIDYYINQLPLQGADYLRVPLVVTPSVTSSGAVYAGNQTTFFAITSGIEGVHGDSFSSSASSKVYGVGLAATPEPTQYTQDLLFSRSYSGFGAVPKEDGYQIGAQYLIRFS